MMLSHAIVGAAIEVHKHLGSGLLESVYEAALNRELTLRGIKVERQVHVPLLYKGLPLDLSVRHVTPSAYSSTSTWSFFGQG
ncbi:MAG TPA: GxxExxY protein [Gemmatimonadales bacterium]|nr:GxxExxY protein [Gemmatimonadales bacterium]